MIQKWKESEKWLRSKQFAWVYDGGKILYSTQEVRNKQTNNDENFAKVSGTESKSWVVSLVESAEEDREMEFTVKVRQGWE